MSLQKRFFSMLLAILLIPGMLLCANAAEANLPLNDTAAVVAAVSAPSEVTAQANFVSASLNNRPVFFYSYVIGGYNYVKLRDLAYVLSGTEKSFEVTWDGAKNRILLLTGQAYTPAGGELEPHGVLLRNEKAVPNSSSILLDGEEITLPAYTINGYNYFMLRDIAGVLDFSVEWSNSTGTVIMNTAHGYVPGDAANSYSFRRLSFELETRYILPRRSAFVSPVQQFPYLDEGIAYAYADGDKLILVTPSKELILDMQYPILGDVTADREGNFYIVWGKGNPYYNYNVDYDPTVETVFISKYSPDGAFIRSAGFTGHSLPWDGDPSANTMEPFVSGNCVSVIHDDLLVCYHAKLRYDGHQSDQVIAVDIRDMSPVELPNNCYTGHSFDQALLYCSRIDDYLFASTGDAYSRGFRVNRTSGRYGDDSEVLFHFYLQSNANYNMFIVNETFAQLGGLAETSRGVVLAGASVRSISENAKTEHQDLFVQIFDPAMLGETSPSMFHGGEARTGATSFDINDSNNSPLTPVTDYGVIWLTEHTDRDVVAPQVVIADDKIVLLWTETDPEQEDSAAAASFYMVLSADGKIETEKTSLGAAALNSFESPVWMNGRVQWVSGDRHIIRVCSIDV